MRRVVAAGADAAIVGSAFINIVAANQPDMLRELEEAASALKAATKT